MALSDSKILFWNGKNPLKSVHFDVVVDEDKGRTEQSAPSPVTTPSLCGVPLKYISYVLSLPFPHRRPHTSDGIRPFSVLSTGVHARILTLFSVFLH